MSINQQTIDLGFDPIPADRTEPRLWVKDFGFFSDFKHESEVRRISLRPGLNIIWAKESEQGASGHAAGKSTFCRLLRYLIGDTSFGSETFRYALRAKRPQAVIAGEVILNGEPWLLCRSLSESGYHWCARGRSYDDLFADDLKTEDYIHFIQALDESFITPLSVATYPGTDKELEWQHLLQWLSRDQDARYSETLNWRLQGDAKHLQSSEKTNLIRLVLGLLDSNELKKQQAHSLHLKSRNEIKTLLPKLQYARDRMVAELKEAEPDLRDGKYDLESRLSELRLARSRQKDSLQKTIDEASETNGIDDILKASAEIKTKTRDALQKHLDAQRREIQKARSRLKYRKGQLSKEEYNRQIAELGDIDGKCSTPIELAIEFKCPLAPSLNRDELSQQRLEVAQETVEEIDALLVKLNSRKELLKAELQNAEAALKPFETKITEKKAAHIQYKRNLNTQFQTLSKRVDDLQSALDDTELLRTKKEQQNQLDENITQSSKDLAVLRKQASKLLSTVTDSYSLVASHLTQTKTDGKIEFYSDAVHSSLDYDGDLSSAALVTLRLLIFDLACLIGSTSADSHHPGLLIHDSPREADLSVHIYRRIFTLIGGHDDQAENESVQYIIATTEAPPEALQQNPWLVCEPLSSAQQETRFLKTIV